MIVGMAVTLLNYSSSSISTRWVLTDSFGVPRYWATVWGFFRLSELADSTSEKNLRYIEAIYHYADQLEYQGALDDAIDSVNLEVQGLPASILTTEANTSSNTNPT